MFKIDDFKKAYETAIKRLKIAERTTKEELQVLSRTVLEALHNTEDVSFVNRLLAVLSPVNKRVAILYFQAFSGFQFNKDDGTFTRKDKKNYEAFHAKAMAFLEDPLNNIWSWSAKEVEMEAKEFTLDRMKKQLESTLKKATDAGFSQVQVMETMMEAGLKLDTVLALMDKITGKAEEPVQA